MSTMTSGTRNSAADCDRERTRQLADGAVSWTRRHLEWFSPEGWNRRLPEREVPVQSALELLLLAVALERCGRAGDAAPMRAAAAEAVVALTADADFDALAEDPMSGVSYLVWAIALLPAEPRLAAARERAGAMLAERGASLLRLDEPRTVRFEAAYAARLGWKIDLPGFAELYGEHPYLGLDVDRLDDGQVYAVTHDVLYGTDFGASPLPISQRGRAEIVEIVARLLSSRREAQQWDLVAELILCLVALDACHESVATALADLADAQLADGAIPGPPYDADAIAALEDPAQAEAVEFRTCYHPTLVAAMAALAVLAQPDQIAAT